MANSKKGEEQGLAIMEDFAPLAVSEDRAQAIAEAIRTNVGEISAFDLDQITWPAGGGLAWEVPALGELKSVTRINCVILHTQEVRQYWEASYSGEGSPPDCACPDVKANIGHGRPGGTCSDCDFSQWGSGKNAKGEPSRGQACQLRRHCLILTEYDALPRFLSIPPTSGKALGKFMLRLAGNELLYYRALVGLKLEKASSADGIDYSRLVPEFLGPLSEKQAAVANAYRKSLMGVITSRATQGAGAERPDDDDPDPTEWTADLGPDTVKSTDFVPG